jgi:hypothetical protein
MITWQEEITARKIVNRERCKHGMIFELCAHCQQVDYQTTCWIPLPITDKNGNIVIDKNGQPKKRFIERPITRTIYRRYR